MPMTTSFRSAALLLAMTAAVVACTSPPPPAPTPSEAPVRPPSIEAQAGDAALAAYNTYWSVSEQALAAPGAKDWTADLQAVARGQALEAITTDIASYADYPAHNEGAVSRDPVIDSVDDRAVTIIDCVDLTNYLLVADGTGEVLTDVANQVPRFRYHARVVQDATDRWLVDQTSPKLDQPC
jgi:hypothetical protein